MGKSKRAGGWSSNHFLMNIEGMCTAVSLFCTFSWVAGTFPRKLLERTLSVRALCNTMTALVCGLAGLLVNICTVQLYGPDTHASWVEQGEITCVIHARSFPRYASPTSKCRVSCSVVHSDGFNPDWFRDYINLNMRILQHSVILTNSANNSKAACSNSAGLSSLRRVRAPAGGVGRAFIGQWSWE